MPDKTLESALKKYPSPQSQMPAMPTVILNWTTIQKLVSHRATLSHYQILMFLLAHRDAKTNVSHPTPVEQLMASFKLCARTVKRALSDLDHWEFINLHKRHV